MLGRASGRGRNRILRVMFTFCRSLEPATKDHKSAKVLKAAAGAYTSFLEVFKSVL
jgi:hypothetical protein